MKLRPVSLLLCGVLLVAAASAQTKSKPAAKSGAPDKAMLQEVMNGWATLDIAQPAKYYDHDPGNVYYDVSPLKYNGWSQYAAGVKPLLDSAQSAKLTVNDDAVMHSAGWWAWGTATVVFEMTPKSGAPSTMTCRWTSIWEKKGGRWVIVHDHFSAPMPEQP